MALALHVWRSRAYCAFLCLQVELPPELKAQVGVVARENAEASLHRDSLVDYAQACQILVSIDPDYRAEVAAALAERMGIVAAVYGEDAAVRADAAADRAAAVALQQQNDEDGEAMVVDSDKTTARRSGLGRGRGGGRNGVRGGSASKKLFDK